jgi:hypothetical protein
VAKKPSISAFGTSLARPAKLPSDLSACAAWMKPVRQCQRAADTDTSHAERCYLLHVHANVANHEEVERFRRNRLNERLHFRAILRTRGEEHVSSAAPYACRRRTDSGNGSGWPTW